MKETTKLNVTFRVSDRASGIKLLELLERLSGGGIGGPDLRDPAYSELTRSLRESTLLEGSVK